MHLRWLILLGLLAYTVACLPSYRSGKALGARTYAREGPVIVGGGASNASSSSASDAVSTSSRRHRTSSRESETAKSSDNSQDPPTPKLSSSSPETRSTLESSHKPYKSTHIRSSMAAASAKSAPDEPHSSMPSTTRVAPPRTTSPSASSEHESDESLSERPNRTQESIQSASQARSSSHAPPGGTDEHTPPPSSHRERSSAQVSSEPADERTTSRPTARHTSAHERSSAKNTDESDRNLPTTTPRRSKSRPKTSDTSDLAVIETPSASDDTQTRSASNEHLSRTNTQSVRPLEPSNSFRSPATSSVRPPRASDTAMVITTPSTTLPSSGTSIIGPAATRSYRSSSERSTYEPTSEAHSPSVISGITLEPPSSESVRSTVRMSATLTSYEPTSWYPQAYTSTRNPLSTYERSSSVWDSQAWSTDRAPFRSSIWQSPPAFSTWRPSLSTPTPSPAAPESISGSSSYGFVNTRSLVLPYANVQESSSSSTLVSSSGGASSSASTSTSSGSSSYPLRIIPQNVTRVQHSDTVLTAVLFKPSMPWPWVVRQRDTTAQIFTYMPRLIATGIEDPPSSVFTKELREYMVNDTSRTLYLVYIPDARVDEFKNAIQSPLDKMAPAQADGVEHQLLEQIDTSFDGYAYAAALPPDGPQPVPVTTRNALVGCFTGVAGLALAGFFIWLMQRFHRRSIARRKRERRSTIKSFSALSNSPVLLARDLPPAPRNSSFYVGDAHSSSITAFESAGVTGTCDVVATPFLGSCPVAPTSPWRPIPPRDAPRSESDEELGVIERYYNYSDLIPHVHASGASSPAATAHRRTRSTSSI